jgi:PHD/YefM family antitoxin component YafN of YafNO toxin-antitoxin module
MAKGNQPVAKFRIGYVTATVWENDKFHNVVLSKSYKDGEEWKDTDQLGAGDLLNAAKVLERAEDFISKQ